METDLQAYFALGNQELKLRLLSNEFFVNGRLLRVNARLYERACDLSSILSRFDLGELAFSPTFDREEMDGFTGDLSQSLRTGTSHLRSGGYGGLSSSSGGSASSAAAFRFEPDRLAIWLYASLLEATQKLYEESSQGNTPSLLPVRRVLQMLIDGMKKKGPIYQMLTLVRDPDVPAASPNHRVATAIDAIGFGYFIGLRSNDLMTLALGGLLGGLSRSPDPYEAVRPLFRYPGLGEAAMPLTLTVFDTRSALQGKPAGIPGRILAVVERYRELIDQGGPCLPFPVALQRMCSGQVPHIDKKIARFFAIYKGPCPLGTLIRLEDSTRGIVIHQGENRSRPTIAVITEDGHIGEKIDLSAHPELRVTGVYSILAERINLSQL